MKIQLTFIIITVLALIVYENSSKNVFDKNRKLYFRGMETKHKRMEYISGRIELEFINFIKTVNRSERFAKKYCKLFFIPRKKRILRIMNDIKKCNNNDFCYNEDFSYYKVRSEDNSKFEYIEPLFGLFREYDYGCGKNSSLEQNLIVGYTNSNIDTVYFDLGATTFKCLAQQFFYRVYKRLNFRFTHWYLWEISILKPSDVFNSIPGDLFSKYHYYNVPVPVDISDQKHPFNIILNNNYNKTYVTMKLDIDTPELELKIFDILLETDEYNDILDELFFEYHFELKDFPPWYLVFYFLIYRIKLIQHVIFYVPSRNF